jgi:mono/diheme cytochrome c family protein
MRARTSPQLRRHLLIAAIVALAIAAIPVAMALFLYSGAYDIGADVPHTKPVFWLISQFRDRSVAVRAAQITPPADLAAPGRIATGAGLYDALCTSCHLAPGMEKTDLSRGLYPKAPQLAFGTDLTPAQEFWTIKHGIKLTAMPAWGRTHSDAEVWDLVAFIRKMPDFDKGQYQAAVKGAPVAPAS